MVSRFAVMSVFGLPLFVYFGILAFVLFLITAAIGRRHFQGNFSIPFKWHPRLAIAAITSASIHVFLAASILFRF